MKRYTSVLVAVVPLLAVLVACSSSNSSNSSAAPSCQGAKSTGAGSTACSACLQASCESQLSAINSSCGAYIACYQGCMCSDVNCLLVCFQTKVDMTCTSAFMPFQNCLMQNCQSPCNGSSTLDGG